MVVAVWLARTQRPNAAVGRFSQWTMVCFVLQLLLGGLNVALKAPVWIQLLHLLTSDLIWISLVLLSASALAQPSQVVNDATRQGTKSLLHGT